MDADSQPTDAGAAWWSWGRVPAPHECAIALALALDAGSVLTHRFGQPAGAITSVLMIAAAALLLRSAAAPGPDMVPPSPRWRRVLVLLMLATWLPGLDVLSDPPARLGAAQIAVISAGGLLLLLALVRGAAVQVLLLLAVLLGTTLRLVSYPTHPIDPVLSDMLPVVRGAVDRFLSGRSPYAIYAMPWQVPLSYLPVTWLAYVPARLLGVDMRLINVALELALAASLAVLAFGRDWRGALSLRGPARPGHWALLLWAWLYLDANGLEWSLRTEHPVFWLLLALALVQVLRGRHGSAAALLGLTLAASPLTAVVLPFIALHWLATQRLRWAALLAGGAAALAAAIVLPFYVWDPQPFTFGVIRWHNDNSLFAGQKWAQDRTWAHEIGFSSLFWQHGLVRLLKPIQALSVMTLAGLFWRAGAAARLLAPFCTLAIVVFMAFNPVVWTYLHWTALVVAMVAIAAPPREQGR